MSATLMKQPQRPNKYPHFFLSLSHPSLLCHPPLFTLAKEIKKTHTPLAKPALRRKKIETEKENVLLRSLVSLIPQIPPPMPGFNRLFQTPGTSLAPNTPTDPLYRRTPHLRNAQKRTGPSCDLRNCRNADCHGFRTALLRDGWD